MDRAADNRDRRGTNPVFPLVIIGNTASGKTTVGRRIAELLRVPFNDLDDVVVARHGTLAQIFADGGEGAFRNLEATTAEELIGGATSPYVLSLGGGATMRPETQQLLSCVRVVWMDARLETVLPRLQARRNRPIYSGDRAAIWQDLDAVRRPVYRRLADFRLDANTESVDELAEKVVRWARSPNRQRKISHALPVDAARLPHACSAEQP